MSNSSFHDKRRDFVKQGTMLAGAIAAAPLISNANFFSGSDDVIKVAVIGCGGRGTGAAVQAGRNRRRSGCASDRLPECGLCRALP